MKADLHLHSEHSWDSTVPIAKYIERAEQLGFGAIAITDHNSIKSHAEIRKLQQRTEVLLVPGQETSTRDGHLLVYGWTDLVPSGLSMKESVEIAKGGGDLVLCVAAHPFDFFRGGKGRKILSAEIDGVEVLNASSLLGYPNWCAKRFARGRFDIQLGNSDSHRSAEFGTAYTRLSECETVEDLLKQLSAGIAEGKRIGIIKKSTRFFRRKLNRMTD